MRPLPMNNPPEESSPAPGATPGVPEVSVPDFSYGKCIFYIVVGLAIALIMLRITTLVVYYYFGHEIKQAIMQIQMKATLEKAAAIAQRHTVAKELLGDNIEVKAIPRNPLTDNPKSMYLDGRLNIEGSRGGGALIVSYDYGINDNFTVLKLDMGGGKFIDLLQEPGSVN